MRRRAGPSSYCWTISVGRSVQHRRVRACPDAPGPGARRRRRVSFASRASADAPTVKPPEGSPSRSPNARSSAARCCWGSARVFPSKGPSTWCSAPRAMPTSASPAPARRTVKPLCPARAAVQSSSAVFPMPVSPRSTFAEPPAADRALCRDRSSSVRSRRRPTGVVSPRPLSTHVPFSCRPVSVTPPRCPSVHDPCPCPQTRPNGLLLPTCDPQGEDGDARVACGPDAGPLRHLYEHFDQGVP